MNNGNKKLKIFCLSKELVDLYYQYLLERQDEIVSNTHNIVSVLIFLSSLGQEYLNEISYTKELVDKLIQELLNKIENNFFDGSLFYGYAGIRIVLGQYSYHEKISDKLLLELESKVDEYVDFFLKFYSFEQYRYRYIDFFTGLCGFAQYYSYINNSSNIKRLNIIITKIYETMKHINMESNATLDQLDISFAHGISGILPLLYQINLQGYELDVSITELRNLVRAVINKKVVSMDENIVANVYIDQANNMSTWCHGNLGVLYAMASEFEVKCTDYIIYQKINKKKVLEPYYFCHGTIGYYYLIRKIFFKQDSTLYFQLFSSELISLMCDIKDRLIHDRIDKSLVLDCNRKYSFLDGLSSIFIFFNYLNGRDIGLMEKLLLLNY